MSDEYTSYIEIDPFITTSKFADKYILHLISLDLHSKKNDIIEKFDDRFSELKKLEIEISNGSLYAIKYTAYRGRGFKIPRFKNTIHL